MGLSARDWLVGDRLTEADIRLFTTLVRFDPVYHGHFKCNLRRIADYPALHAFTGRMMEVEGVRDTVNLDHIKRHYYESHPTRSEEHTSELQSLMRISYAVFC